MIAQALTVQASVAGTRGLWSKLAWPLLLACGLLVFVSASSIYLVISSQSSRDATNRALQLENRLWETMAVVRIAESEQRGYLLTGDPGYLEIYRNTIDASVAALADVRSAAAGSPVQRRAVAEIEPLMLRKFDELRETMRLYDSGDHAAALALVRTGLGLDLMTRIRVATLRSMDEQQRLVSLRTSNSASTNIWLLSVNLLGFALIIVLAVISVLVIRRAAGKELAQSESRGDELRATADQRHKAEQKFKEMLEAAPDAMVVVNQGGEIILLNLQAEKQFGYRRDELLGQKVTNIIPEGFAERLIADGLRSAEDALAQQIGTGIELIGQAQGWRRVSDRDHAEPAGKHRRNSGDGGDPRHQRPQGGGKASGADGGQVSRAARGGSRCDGGGQPGWGDHPAEPCRRRKSSDIAATNFLGRK